MALKILIGLAILYVLLCAFAYIFGERIAFPAPEASYTQKSLPKIEFIDAACGKIACIHLKNPGAKYTVFYSHGNGEDIGEIMPILTNFFNSGFSVFAYDYYGYGLSSGTSNFKNLYECADSAWNFLTEKKKVPETNIAIFGYSMGSAPSCYLASKHKARALVLLGGFASAFEAVLPVNILPWAPLNNAKLIASAKSPILIVHGRRDAIVPFRNGLKLFKSATSDKNFIELKESGHFNAYDLYPNIVPEAFFDFINNLKLDDKFVDKK